MSLEVEDDLFKATPNTPSQLGHSHAAQPPLLERWETSRAEGLSQC
jgi:hypothetical protein